MKPHEIANKIKSENPEKLEMISDKTITYLIRKTFQEISSIVQNTNEGVVKIQGLGNFNIKQVEINKDEEKIIVKRVFFKPFKPKK